ncbi:MAG TPA: DUF4157 domain-containing protein [Longimicrobiaceae bacterium]|jgi:hypothetical protein|nr:DUF4157 domain-containing protein [Longimicrobiaceae bacterium]
MSTHAEDLLERAPAPPRLTPALAESVHAPAVPLMRAASPAALRPADVLALQRSVGNRAVQRMIAARPVVQTKLTVNTVGDVYEQEAERVSRQVAAGIGSPGVDEREEEDALMTAPLLQREGDEAGGAPVEPEVESAIDSARGGGRPMDASIRASMESAFGADFSGVRVHTGAAADSLNQAVQARAFTTGQDVFFSGGAYDPGSGAGRELLAHELTHVVQQNGDDVRRKESSEG